MKQHECPRVIYPDKYERQNKDAFDWWLRLFEMMENDYAIPQYKRKEVIKQIFPDHILEKIVSLVAIIDEEGNIEKKTESATSIDQHRYRSSLTWASRTSLRRKSDAIPKSDIDFVSKTEILSQSAKQRLTSRQDEQLREAGPNNAYLKFFKTNPERVAIWRVLPPISLEDMNLSQKAEAITEMIAIDFIEWMINLGGETPTTLDVPQVVKMFEIGFNMHAAKSLVVKLKELPAVPKFVAESRLRPERAFREILSSKLQDDIRAFKKKRKLRAFDTTLPYELLYTPPKENAAEKWLREKAPKHLETMSAVWEGITELRSTRAFCKWLMAHPEVPSPKYLEEMGMLTTSFFEKPHYSIETQNSVTDQQSLSVTDFLKQSLQ